MELDIISYHDLHDSHNKHINEQLEAALVTKGIVGIKDIPQFEETSRRFIKAARQFSALDENIKQRYSPNRDAGDTEGYECGAEQFRDENNIWRTDDKKSSYYAFIPDKQQNKWPDETDLKSPYLELGLIIFETGKRLLNIMGLNESVGLHHKQLNGYGRMLHYLKESDASNANPDWCGGHYDHGIFTGLLPAYYYRNGIEVDEPIEAGLYITPTNGHHYEKIQASDKSILLFQAGEAGQLISNDRIKATKHIVKKAQGEIERYTFALFYDADPAYQIKSNSILTNDARYHQFKKEDGHLNYCDWSTASFERYRAK